MRSPAHAGSGFPDRNEYVARLYDAGIFGNQNLAAAMDRGAALYGDSETIFHSDTRPGRYSLSHLHARSLRIAGALYSLGIRQGDTIAVQLPNWVENILIYQAAMQLGATILPIVHIYGPKEVGFILQSSGARAFVIAERWRNIDFVDQLTRLPLGAVEAVVVIGTNIPEGALSWDKLEQLGTDAFPHSTAAPDDPCLLLYTSGTTTNPKGVVHTHNGLIAANRMYEILGGMSPETVTLGAGPAGHIGGVLNVLKLFLTGSGTVMLDVWSARAAAELIAAHGISQCNGTPYFLSTLLDAADTAGVSLATMNRYMVGGASVPPALIERADRVGLKTCRAYGSTEACTVTASYSGDPLEKRAYTDGRATPRSQVKIVGPDGRDMPAGGEGEVAILAPQLFLGYSDPALNLDSFTQDGWFLSGDIGRLDAEGYLTITDRKKDIIIRGGENISSREVEDVLAMHPAVFESAVIAMPDPEMGEKVCAFVKLRAAGEFGLEEVRSHFRACGVARQKTPERIIIVNDFPRTAAGKVKKFELRRKLTDPAGI